MLTNPWLRAICWHMWRPVRCDAKWEGKRMLVCMWCWQTAKED